VSPSSDLGHEPLAPLPSSSATEPVGS
jgi:hypothetical protein